MPKHGKRIANEVCPRCKGTGIARAFKRGNKYSKEIVAKAKRLFKAGYPLRKIGEAVGIKHPYSVKKLLIRN